MLETMSIAGLAYPCLILAGLYILVSYYQSYVTEKRFRKFAVDNGAELPRRPPYKLPWGLDMFYRVINAEKNGEDIFDDIILARMKNSKCWSVETTVPFGTKLINTAEPKNIQAMLATQFNDFELGSQREAQFKVVLGKSIFNVDGAAWAHARALFRPQFVRENINDLEETERATKLLIDVFPRGQDGWTDVVDLMPLFFNFTLDTATAFIFGKSVDSQLASSAGTTEVSEELVGFAEAFSTSQLWVSRRIRLQGLYWLCDGLGYRRELRRFGDLRVTLSSRHCRPEAIQKSRTKEEISTSVVAELAKATQSPVEMRDHLMALLAAGRDSTAALLSWLLYLLATHPKVFDKLRDTVVSDFGTSPTTGKKIDFASLKSCRYLQHVISESLRLYPIVAINNRRAVRDTTLPVGGGADGSKPIPIRKGQTVSFVPYVMHRRPDIWGEDVNEFKPERFQDRKQDWSFLPFSGGPRVCIGQQYAITEASFLIVRLLQQFDAIEWAGSLSKPKKSLGLTLTPKDGVQVRLRYA